MPRSTLIISDTHLGRPHKANTDSLRPLWQGVDELIINGDAAEVQIPWLRVAALRELDKLADLTRRDGVELTLISGNHDAYLTDTRCIERADQRILIMHGDALHPAVAPWTRSAGAMEKLTERAMADLPPAERDSLLGRLSVAQHVGHSEFLEEYVLSSRGEGGFWHAIGRPMQVLRVMRYWRQEVKLAQRFIDQYTPQTQVLILGHSHRPGVWHLGTRTIINTGAFLFPGRPWCAVIDESRLHVYRLKLKSGHFHRQDKPVYSTSLQSKACDPHAMPAVTYSMPSTGK